MERVGWETFTGEVLDWRQGEHVSLIGPTGGGKTTLGLRLLPQREWSCVLATKPADPTLAGLRREGYMLLREWPPPPLENRILLWPKFRDKFDLPTQRAVIGDAVVGMFGVGGWTLFADELSYLCQMLRLDTDLRLIWQQGRALNLSLVGATQRPAWVPLELYSQATHLFFWRTNDRRDLDRIGGIGSVDPAVIRRMVARLPKYEALYVNTRTGTMVQTQADLRR